MSAGFRRFVFRSKVVLCLLLIANVQFFIAGCGTASVPLPAEQLRIPLSPGDALNTALSTTPFVSAAAIDLFPNQQSFSLELPNKSQQLSGKYAYADGEFTITELFLKNRDQSATIDLNSTKQISRIITSDGTTWKLPDSGRAAASSQSSGLNAYLDANSSLLDFAKQIDIANGTADSPAYGTLGTAGSNANTNPDPKSTASLSDPLTAVLLAFAALWYPFIGIWPGLIGVFTIASVFQGAMIARFDGDWAATSSGSKLMLTISRGKITQMVDPSSGQQLDIADSTLTSVQGDHVVWTVNANVLGQNVPVTFEFDVQEMSDGSLQGTLTTEGSNFARVPVTLTRS